LLLLTVNDFAKIDTVFGSFCGWQGLEGGLASRFRQDALKLLLYAGIKADDFDHVTCFHLLEVIADLQHGKGYDRFSQIKSYHKSQPYTDVLAPTSLSK
jgi:hypothetical protein